MAEAARPRPGAAVVATRERRPVDLAAFAAFAFVAALCCLVWALLLPYNHAPDEADHFALASYIAEHGALPVYDQSPGFAHTNCSTPRGPCVGSYATLPPAAPILAAALIAISHAASGTPDTNLVLAARLASVLSYGLYVFALAMVAREILPDRRMAWTALLIGAFVPQVVFTGAYVNDDAFGMAAATGLLACAVVLVRRPVTARFLAGAGVVAGLVILGKLTAWVTLPVFAVALVYRIWKDRRPEKLVAAAGRLALPGVVALVLSGWWLARNWALYGDPSGASTVFRAFERLAPDYRLRTLAGQGHPFGYLFGHTDWLLVSFQSFWGYFDYLTLPMPKRIYAAIAAGCVLACLGAGVGAARVVMSRGGRRDLGLWRSVALLGSVAVGALLLSAWTSYSNDYQAQGRYLFAALAPVSLFLAAGLHGWSTSHRYRSFVLAATVVGAPLLMLYALLFVIVPAYSHHPPV